MKLLQIVLGAWMLACGHVFCDESPIEVFPRSDGVRPEAEELVVRRLVEHDGQMVCHHIFTSTSGTHSDLIQRQPLLGVGLAIVCVYPKDLEARGPPDGSQPSHEGT